MDFLETCYKYDASIAHARLCHAVYDTSVVIMQAYEV